MTEDEFIGRIGSLSDFQLNYLIELMFEAGFLNMQVALDSPKGRVGNHEISELIF